jgi:signal transduction histidine kinase
MGQETSVHSVGITRHFALAAQELSSARDIQTVIQIVRKAARVIGQAEGATLVLREGQMCHYAGEDAISPLWEGSRFPINTCISGWVMQNKTSVVIPDIYADNRIPHEAYRPTFVKSLTMVPVGAADPVGAIGNYWSSQHSPDEDQLALLQSLAELTAISIGNIRMYQGLENAAQVSAAALRNANSDLGSFSHAVAHDLQAPLRIVHGYLDILIEEYGSTMEPGAKLHAEKARHAADKMSTLVRDLVGFYRSGKKELVCARINMELLARSAFSQLREERQVGSISFLVNEMPEAIADGVIMREVWLNLLSNAVKYSANKEKPEIETGGWSDKKEIIYYVKDNGAGFNMEYADKLFRVFQRLHSPREFGGNGIGLAKTQRMINRHGGRIWAESEEGRGAVFYFSLPLSRDESHPPL